MNGNPISQDRTGSRSMKSCLNGVHNEWPLHDGTPPFEQMFEGVLPGDMCVRECGALLPVPLEEP